MIKLHFSTPMINNLIEFFRFYLSVNQIAVPTECSYLRKRKRLDIVTVDLTRVKYGGWKI